MFAKVLVEVSIDQVFPDKIQFLDEKGSIIDQMVEYDWIPITCRLCKGIVHNQDNYSRVRNNGRKVWKPKAVQPQVIVASPKQVSQGDAVIHTLYQVNDGFVLATGFSKQKCSQMKPASSSFFYQMKSLTTLTLWWT